VTLNRTHRKIQIYPPVTLNRTHRKIQIYPKVTINRTRMELHRDTKNLILGKCLKFLHEEVVKEDRQPPLHPE